MPVLNPPRAVEAAVDKYLALARLDAAGLPVPPTWAGESARDAMAAFEALGGDVVVKPLFGSEGRGLVRVSDPELARAGLPGARTDRTRSSTFRQYVRHDGHDLRAFVLGGRVLGAIRRTAAGRRVADERRRRRHAPRPSGSTPTPSGWRSAPPGPSAPSMAGVDLLPDLDAGRLVVLEVNAVPGWRALAAATGVDVAAAILRRFAGTRLMHIDAFLARSHLNDGALACILEATARKPGNVHPVRDFDDAHYLDFVLSALLLDPLLNPAAIRTLGVGAAVLRRRRGDAAPSSATTRTSAWSCCSSPLAAVRDRDDPRAGVGRVLGPLTVEDAESRLRGDPARPARRARHGDRAGRLPASRPSRSWRRCGWPPTATRSPASTRPTTPTSSSWPCPPSAPRWPPAGRLELAIVHVHLVLMAERPDTLIPASAARPSPPSRPAAPPTSSAPAGPTPPARSTSCEPSTPGSAATATRRNPGATADLIAATLSVALRIGTIDPLRHLRRAAWDGGDAF